MRVPDVLLGVLFPIVIAVGIALGIDAVSPAQFGFARTAFVFSAAIAFGLAFWWFYRADITLAVAIMFSFTCGCIGFALFGSLYWLNLKENIFCYIGAFPEESAYRLTIWSNGPYPSLNVRVSISNPGGDFALKTEIYDVGDVEPMPARRLLNIPTIGPGTYKIRIQTRTGFFLETLTVQPGLVTRVDLQRVVFNQDGSSVLKPLQ